MMQFAYTAKDNSGRTVQGTLEADSEDALADLLDQQNLFLVEASPSAAKPRWGALRKRIRSSDIMSFTMDLSTMLAAGIPLTQALTDLADAGDNPQFTAIIEDLLASIQSGSSLSAAFERHPKQFDTVYVSIVRAGETSGSLDRVLADLGSFLEWKADLRREVTQAAIYPAMVLCAVFGLIILLSVFVFPQFARILDQARGPVPLPTQILFFASSLFRNYWWVLGLMVVSVFWGVWFWLRTQSGRATFDRIILKVPVVGDLVQKIALSRFCHFFQILFSAGVDISHSLQIVESVVGNTVISEATRAVGSDIRAGQSLATAIEGTRKFPKLVVRVFHIGETSGQLVGSLEKACRYYDKEIPATVKKVFAVIEPLLYVVLGLVILLVAVAIYMPLYQMIGTLQGR
jgi:type II secretory pathway component PulF